MTAQCLLCRLQVLKLSECSWCVDELLPAATADTDHAADTSLPLLATVYDTTTAAPANKGRSRPRKLLSIYLPRPDLTQEEFTYKKGNQDLLDLRRFLLNVSWRLSTMTCHPVCVLKSL